MQVSVTARHFKATDRLKKYAKNEIQRLEKFFDGIIDCNVVLDYIKSNQSKHVAEIHLKVHGRTLSVSEISNDMYKSIDYAINKLERKLQKYKARLRSYSHKKAVDLVANNSDIFEEE